MKGIKLIAVSVSLALCSAPAFAGKEKCKDVKIHVVNDSDRDIKVVDIKYWDSTIGDWRNENGVKGKKAAQNGGEVDYTRGLEEVKNDPEMKVKVEYKQNVLGKWKNAAWSTPSPVKKCTKGQDYEVTIN